MTLARLGLNFMVLGHCIVLTRPFKLVIPIGDPNSHVISFTRPSGGLTAIGDQVTSFTRPQHPKSNR